MVKKRKLLILASVICLALLGSCVYLWVTGAFRNRITQSTANRIRKGMTENEVIDLVGKPPGNYMLLQRNLLPPQVRQEGHIGNAFGVIDKKTIDEGVACLEWFSDECGIFVMLDKRGQVVWSYCEIWPPWLEDELPRLIKRKR